jgi:regulator of protease activity HflC (stomatin/prohibitin superfamily)
MTDSDLGPLIGMVTPIAIIGILVALILLWWGFFILEPRTACVLMYWGKYSRTIMTPGIHWAFPIGLSWQRVSLRDRVFQSALTTVVDAMGNPIQVSAVCVFRVVEPVRAVLEVQNYVQFVANQASTVLKGVCSRYPYESRDPSQPCLKKESETIMAALAGQLQAQATAAGVEILLVRLNDLAYAPEIAQAMLLRQQAQALVDARRTLVEGAVTTVQDGIQRLEMAQIRLSPVRRNHLISNLTLLLCAGERGEQHSTVVSRQR